MDIDLSSYHIFEELEGDSLKAAAAYLAPSLKIEEISSRTTVLTPGDEVNDLILVERGVIKIIKYLPDGKEIVGDIFTDHQVFGFMEIVKEIPVRSYLQAEKGSRLIFIPKARFLKLMEMMIPFKDAVISFLCSHIDRLISYSIVLKYKKVRDRICMHLYNQYYRNPHKQSTDFYFTLDFFAQYLNLTRSAVSRELHDMEAQGIITLEKTKIHIRKIEVIKEVLGFE